MSEPIILASQSPYRQSMLRAAAVPFEAISPQVDERAVEDALAGSGVTPDEVATVLAEAKAIEVSERNPGRLVLGCDQTLALGDEVFHKPADMDAARRQLLALSGKTHQLSSAAVLARDGETCWRHVDIARLTMRRLDPGFIGRYLSLAGPGILGSVGAYQIEGPGIQLFESVEGDHFTIVGLPLLPVLAELRRLRAIDG